MESALILICSREQAPAWNHTITAVSHRSPSEDGAAVFRVDDKLVVVVADGAGGIRGGGAVLARTRIEEVIRQVAFTARKRLGSETLPKF